MSVRVIAGSAKGLRLETPKSELTRPTADRIKGSLFNIIINYLDNAVVLDLFAGTGGLGIEALSRGAKFATFVEANRKTFEIIKNNLAYTKFSELSEVYNNDFESTLKNLANKKSKFDIIFLDPPYGKEFEIQAIKKICEYDLLNKEGIIVVESENILNDIIKDIQKFDEREYGRTRLSFFKRRE